MLDRFDQQLSRWLPWIGAALCLVLGAWYVFIVPPLQVPDEFAHVIRTYGLSQGHFVAPAFTILPTSVQKFMSQFPPHIENKRKLTTSEIWADLYDPLNPHEEFKAANQGMNVNTWIPYIPSAAAFAIARLVHASPLAMLYAGRLANLLGYTALTWLALYLLPAGRLALLTIALMPMTLHQAGGLSWDSIVFGLGFVFCAMVVRYAVAESGPLRMRDYLALSLAVLIISLCKVDFALLPMLLLIPPSKFPSLRTQIGFLAACAGVAVVANAVWQYADRDNLELFRQSIQAQLGANMTEHVGYLVHYPGYFIDALVRSMELTSYRHLREFVGTFGWLAVKVPAWAAYLYPCIMLAVALTTLTELQLTWMQRAVLLFVYLLGCLACILAMWMATPDSYMQDAILKGKGTLWGIQGRHFIPFVLPSLLLLANPFLRVRLFWAFSGALLLIILVNVDSLVAIGRAFYA